MSDLRGLEIQVSDAVFKSDPDKAFFEIVVKDFVSFQGFLRAKPFAALAFFIVNAEFENSVDPGNTAQFQDVGKFLIGAGGAGENQDTSEAKTPETEEGLNCEFLAAHKLSEQARIAVSGI